MEFWDVIWFIIVSFAFIAYLMVMFNIITDLFRDHETSGGVKAVWIVALIFAPFLTALIYLVVRGRGMAERQMRAVQQVQETQASYIQSLTADGGVAPSDQISRAKGLLDEGTITQEEFERLKAKALS